MAPADRPDEFGIAGACPVNLLRWLFRHRVRKLRMQKIIFSLGELLRSWLEFGRVKSDSIAVPIGGALRLGRLVIRPASDGDKRSQRASRGCLTRAAIRA